MFLHVNHGRGRLSIIHAIFWAGQRRSCRPGLGLVYSQYLRHVRRNVYGRAGVINAVS